MVTERNKKEVLEQVSQARTAFEAVLARYDDAQMLNLISSDGWNLRDVMAHITYWESYAVDRFQAASRGEKSTKPLVIGDEELNRINQAALDAGRKKTLADVQADFKRVHADLVAAVEAIPEDRNHPWWSVWPDHDLPWLLVEYNTWGHYDEHLRDMEKWL